MAYVDKKVPLVFHPKENISVTVYNFYLYTLNTKIL